MTREDRQWTLRRGSVRLVALVLVVLVGAVSARVLPGVGNPSGFDPLFDGWLKGAAYLVAAGLAVLWPVVSPVRRRAWTWVAAALATRAAGFVVHLSVIRWMEPVPYPSVADLFWVLSALLLIGGLVELARDEFPQGSVAVVLDAVVATLAAAALAVSLLFETLRSIGASEPSGAVLATNLAYPVLDIGMLVAVVALLASYRWRPPGVIWVLTVGVLGLAATDAIFVYQVAAGSFRPGSALSVLSLVATAVTAIAPWVRRRHERSAGQSKLPDIVAPMVFALICVGLLVWGSQRPVPLVAALLAGAGLLVAALRTGLTFRLVAEVARRRQAEELARELRELNDELRTAVKVREHILAATTHELRTPLTPVLGMIQVIRHRWDQLDTEQLHSYLEVVDRNATRLGKLVEDLLVASQLQAGPVKANPEVLHLHDHLRSALRLWPETSDVVIDGDELDVLCESEHLDQILTHMIANAVKYGEPPYRISTRHDAGVATLTVHDAGRGIPEELVDLLFEPFVQGSVGDRRTASGLGLGLSIARALALANGGQLTYRPCESGGADFVLQLDAVTAEHRPDSGRQAPAGRAHQARRRGTRSGPTNHA